MSKTKTRTVASDVHTLLTLEWREWRYRYNYRNHSNTACNVRTHCTGRVKEEEEEEEEEEETRCEWWQDKDDD